MLISGNTNIIKNRKQRLSKNSFPEEGNETGCALTDRDYC